MSSHAVTATSIAGLFRIDVPVHGDTRGWFKENYHEAKLQEKGLPAFSIVQNNVSYNEQAGVTRGVHAEPWDKFISPAIGRLFAAIVDLRGGAGFGRVETFELSPSTALFVPRGCGNSFCTLEPHTVYNYLVNDHWRPDLAYPAVDLFDPSLGIPWPVRPEDMVISDKDRDNPPLSEFVPVEVTW